MKLSEMIRLSEIHNLRSVVLATYALCGFSHIASLAIFLGGISALVPKRTSDLIKVSLRAFISATAACLMTACIAGIFYHKEAYILK